jgi:hypothetical protein
VVLKCPQAESTKKRRPRARPQVKGDLAIAIQSIEEVEGVISWRIVVEKDLFAGYYQVLNAIIQ